MSSGATNKKPDVFEEPVEIRTKEHVRGDSTIEYRLLCPKNREIKALSGCETCPYKSAFTAPENDDSDYDGRLGVLCEYFMKMDEKECEQYRKREFFFSGKQKTIKPVKDNIVDELHHRFVHPHARSELE